MKRTILHFSINTVAAQGELAIEANKNRKKSLSIKGSPP